MDFIGNNPFKRHSFQEQISLLRKAGRGAGRRRHDPGPVGGRFPLPASPGRWRGAASRESRAPLLSAVRFFPRPLSICGIKALKKILPGALCGWFCECLSSYGAHCGTFSAFFSKTLGLYAVCRAEMMRAFGRNLRALSEEENTLHNPRLLDENIMNIYERKFQNTPIKNMDNENFCKEFCHRQN